MHVVIGLLTAVAGLIWALVALERAGFRLSSPFALFRRYQWSKKYSRKPLHSLTEPMDVVAVLLLGVAKCEGEISADQKRQLLNIFEQEFQISADEASDLLLASSHLIRNEIYLSDQIDKILEPSLSRFTDSHIQTVDSMLRQVASLESPPNDEQQKLIEGVRRNFGSTAGAQGKWK
ncbi:MAG: hypothetical protein JSU95_17515 [Betaproteobacteria bacterium]|nr:MAG: hypothetical protein JSU95_17515 [Betaproteobacteria bacterium]